MNVISGPQSWTVKCAPYLREEEDEYFRVVFPWAKKEQMYSASLIGSIRD